MKHKLFIDVENDVWANIIRNVPSKVQIQAWDQVWRPLRFQIEANVKNPIALLTSWK